VQTLGTAINGKLDKTGGAMTGNLTVPKVVYSGARTHKYSVSGDLFRPRLSTDAYNSGLGNGGARITTAASTGTLMAQANLPDGAIVTDVTYYLYDNDGTNDLKIYTFIQYFAGGYSSIHPDTTIVSAGADSAVQTFTVATTYGSNISNSGSAIVIFVVPVSGSTWSSNLAIRGVTFTYTLSEAP
jgi:hypothetical protein